MMNLFNYPNYTVALNTTIKALNSFVAQPFVLRQTRLFTTSFCFSISSSIILFNSKKEQTGITEESAIIVSSNTEIDREESKQTTILLNYVIVYTNLDTEKSQILSDLKGKAGIYLWTHKELGKSYVGSAIDLSKRLKNYFNKSNLESNKTMYINKAILSHGYQSFSLTIFEYIDISNLSKEETKKLIISREQYYIDSLNPEYNLLPIAGSRLGSKHSAETIAKMSGENHPMFGKSKEESPMYGKTHSVETKVKMRETRKSLGIRGENHPMFGKTHTTEILAKMSDAKTGENNPMFGQTHSAETVIKQSIAKGGGSIYVYNTQGILVNNFTSARKAAKYFNCSHPTILIYVKNNELFQNQWILSFSENYISATRDNSSDN